MRKYIIALIVFVFNLSAFGQEVPKIIPPSPETATILQHSPVNVSLYTGTPNISVPFYTISHGGVEVPILLSYNSDGIRVENIASWAGLGWSLNAGGLVSRTINKLPDDASIGYMNTTYTIEDFREREDSNVSPTTREGQLSTTHGYGEYRDYEPDTFVFSFLNYSGQFYYNQEEGEFNQAPLTNLRIETIKSSGIIQGFIITDETGVKYHFGVSKDGNRTARELLKDAKTKSLTYDGVFESNPPFSMGALNCYQSWMLLDIEFPTYNEMIKFTYFVEENVEAWTITEQELIKGGGGCQEDNLNYLKKRFDQPKIASINFPTGKVIFEKDTTERLDLNNSFALKSMQLLDNSDVIIKKIQLHTSYMVSLPGNESLFLDLAELDRGKYRLRLDSLSIDNGNGQTDGRYVFDYDAQKLPNRYSKSVDYFGYYNGKNNTSFLPKTYHYAIGTSAVFIGTANRSINPAFTQSSVLKKVYYPTGGYDEFIWENNDISFFTGNASTYRDHLIDKTAYLTSDLYLFGDSDPSIDFSTEFTIQEGLFGAVDFSIMMTGCDPPNLNHMDCDFKLKIVGVSDPSFNYIITQSDFSINSQSLPPGTYKITAKSKVPYVDPNQQTGNGPFPMFQLTAKWSYDPTPNEWMYGGLRIKTIKTYHKEDSIVFSKSYSYKYFNQNSNLSSGSTVNMIDVLNNNYWVSSCGAEGLGFKLTSNSQSHNMITKGSFVGYQNVTEEFNNENQGYNQYTYTFYDLHPDYMTLETTEFPFLYGAEFPYKFKKPLYFDWMNGNIKKIETFDSNNRKLSLKEYNYETANQKSNPFFAIQQLRYQLYLRYCTAPVGPCDNIKAIYNLALTEHHRLKRVTETNYFDNGTNAVTLTKEYSYNALSQMSEERVYDNNHLDKTTKYFYPSDASMSAKPAVTQLKAKHMIGIPLVTETYRNTEKLSTQETVYKNWDTTNNPLLLPELMKTSKGVGVSEIRLRYQAYDSQGNPTQVRTEQGLITSYIWGYNKTQPIAKLDNMTNAAVATATGIAFNDLNESHLTTINNIRTNGVYSNAQITTLTYKPLIGVTSVTDPRGQTTTYEYDSFGRLERVKDHQGNILSENEYHYRTQN